MFGQLDEPINEQTGQVDIALKTNIHMRTLVLLQYIPFTLETVGKTNKMITIADTFLLFCDLFNHFL